MHNTIPTKKQFGCYSSLFDYFNDKLFGGELPPVMLHFDRKGRRTQGYFATERWTDETGKKIHEICLNPATLENEPKELMQTLVHEMAHLWQQEFGKPSRSGYHNREWGDKMEDIGLMPSNTGEPGGNRTGQQMADYAIEGGLFENAFEDLPNEFYLPFLSKDFSNPSKPSSRTKYSCPDCEANVWGKKELRVMCADCSELMEAA